MDKQISKKLYLVAIIPFAGLPLMMWCMYKVCRIYGYKKLFLYQLYIYITLIALLFSSLYPYITLVNENRIGTTAYFSLMWVIACVAIVCWSLIGVFVYSKVTNPKRINLQ